MIGAQLIAIGAAQCPAPAPPVAMVTGAHLDLTQREQGILQLLSAGHTNKQIGRELALTENTVKFHLRNIFAKLQVNTRTGAISASRQLVLLL